MIRVRWLLALGFIVCGLLSSCSNGFVSSFAGTSWTLESLNGTAPLEGTQVTLEFGNGTVAGNSSCNTYSGGFTATADTLTFSNVSSTLIGCDAAIMAQEAAFLLALGSEATYQCSETELTLTNKANAQVLVFAPATP